MYLDYNVSSGPFSSFEIEIGDRPGPELDNFLEPLKLNLRKLELKTSDLIFLQNISYSSVIHLESLKLVKCINWNIYINKVTVRCRTFFV